MRQKGVRALYQLSETEALDAMQEFLWLHADHGSDTPTDLAILVLREEDGWPLDAAVWIDWLVCLRKVKGLEATRDAALQDAIQGGGCLGREAAAWVEKRRAAGAHEATRSGDIPAR